MFPRTNPDKYILLKSVLSRLATIADSEKEQALYVYLDVTAYIHPALFSNILQILRSAPAEDDITIFTAQTVSVTTLNKKSPFLGITLDMIQKAEHQMDVLMFRYDFLQLLQKHLPDDVIVFNMQDILLHIAFTNHVQVVDLTPSSLTTLHALHVVFVLKKRIALTAQEKQMISTNTNIMKQNELSFFTMAELDPQKIVPLSSSQIRIVRQVPYRYDTSLKLISYLAKTTSLFCKIATSRLL